MKNFAEEMRERAEAYALSILPSGHPRHRMVLLAYIAGHRAALTSELVTAMADAIAYVLKYDQNSPERKRLGDALAAYERASSGKGE